MHESSRKGNHNGGKRQVVLSCEAFYQCHSPFRSDLHPQRISLITQKSCTQLANNPLAISGLSRMSSAEMWPQQVRRLAHSHCCYTTTIEEIFLLMKLWGRAATFKWKNNLLIIKQDLKTRSTSGHTARRDNTPSRKYRRSGHSATTYALCCRCRITSSAYFHLHSLLNYNRWKWQLRDRSFTESMSTKQKQHFPPKFMICLCLHKHINLVVVSAATLPL